MAIAGADKGTQSKSRCTTGVGKMGTKPAFQLSSAPSQSDRPAAPSSSVKQLERDKKIGELCPYDLDGILINR